MSGILGGLPAYEPRVQQQIVGPPGMVNTGDGGAGGMFALSRSLSNVASMFEGQADQFQADRGREAGQNVTIDRDPATGLPVAPQFRRDGTPGGRAFDTAARVAYLDTWKQTVTTEAVREAANHRATPEAFIARMGQRIATMTENAPAEFRQELAREAQGVVEGIGRQLLTGWANEQYRQAGQAWSQQAETYETTHRLLMRDPDLPTNDPRLQEVQARFEEQLARGVAAGHISLDQARLRREEFAAQGVVSRASASVLQIARTQGVEAAMERWRDIQRNPDFAAAGPRFMAWVDSTIRADLQDLRIGQSASRQMLASDWRTLEANARAGVNVPTEQFEAIARRAITQGAPDIAAEARAFATVAPQVAALSRAPMPELQQALIEATFGNPNDLATGMLRRAVAHMVQERSQALHRDPAGFAAQHPTVVEARQAVAQGRGTMRDVVAASDAVQAANGVPESMRRVLPDSEVERIKATVATGDGGRAREELQTLFASYGPEMRWRVWNDLRAGGVPESVRPAMLLMASGQQGALTTYMNARAMGDEALRRAAGDKTQQIRDRMASDSTLTELRRTGSGFGHDQALLRDVDDAVETLALFHAREMSASDALRMAVDQVVRPLGQVVSDRGAAFRIPSGTPVSPQEFRALLFQAASPTSLSRLRFNLDSSGIDPSLPDAQRQDQFRRALVAQGTWRTSQDGQGVWYHDGRGRPVFTEDGRPVEVRFEEAPRATVANLRMFQPSPLGHLMAAAAQEGVPQDEFSGLLRAESNGDARAVSRVGALGVAQLMPGTARQVAREIGVDLPADEAALRERLLSDPALNARLGARYYRQMRDRYADRGVARVPLAHAAYNAGPGLVDAWLSGQRADLPRETWEHVRKITGFQGEAALRAARQ